MTRKTRTPDTPDLAAAIAELETVPTPTPKPAAPTPAAARAHPDAPTATGAFVLRRTGEHQASYVWDPAAKQDVQQLPLSADVRGLLFALSTLESLPGMPFIQFCSDNAALVRSCEREYRRAKQWTALAPLVKAFKGQAAS